MSPFRSLSICSILISVLVATSLQSAEVVDITELFPTANTATTLTFRIPSQMDAGSAQQTFSIKNYDGRLITEGRTAVNDNGQYTITATLPAGYHEIIIESEDEAQAVGLWAISADAPEPDGFLSIDTALSWLVKPEVRPVLIQNLRHVIGSDGLARERFTWNEVSPTPTSQEWEGRRQYETTRKLYSKNGIKILEMFHDVPVWMKTGASEKYPEDLIAAGRAWSQVALRWHGFWDSLEVWNEPDHPGFSNNQPADQYLPLVKTARHAMRQAGVSTPIGGGVVAAMNPVFLEQAALNGLLDESDFISFHYYGDPLGIERLVGQFRAWMSMYGHETKPLWMTEVGMSRPGKTDSRPSSLLQKQTALVYAMQAIEAKACGISRFFPFVYVSYSEHAESRHFGMLDANRTPLRMLAASAQAGRMLAGMEYAGDLPTALIAGAKRIRVFMPKSDVSRPIDEQALVVVYLGAATDNAKTISIPFNASVAYGIDGREIMLDKHSLQIPVADGLVYLRTSGASLGKILEKDTEAMRLHRLARTPPTPAAAVSSIVLQPRIEAENVQTVSTRGYFLPADRKRLPVTINVNNLGSETRVVTLRAENDIGVGKRVSIKGGTHERVTIETEIDGLPMSQANDARLLIIKARADDETRIAPVALTLIPSRGEDDIASYLKNSGYHFSLTVGEAYRWDRNANGPITFTHTPPAAWGFSIKFPPNVDRWAYPRFSVPQEVDQSRITGLLVRARCLQPGTVRLLSWDGENVMSMTQFPIIPADGEWHVAHIPLASYQGFNVASPGAIRVAKLSIGFNSQTDENALEISDLYFIGK